MNIRLGIHVYRVIVHVKHVIIPLPTHAHHAIKMDNINYSLLNCKHVQVFVMIIIILMIKIYANCVIRHVMNVMAILMRIVLVVHHKDILMMIKILVIRALINVQLV